MAKILLIDDDRAFRVTVRKILETMGHTVTEASDGKQGVRAVEADQPDLVICDMVMPEQEGLETIGELRRKHPDLRILAVSGGGRASSLSYMRLAEKLGATAGLAKPFSIDELRIALDRLLPTPGR